MELLDLLWRGDSDIFVKLVLTVRELLEFFSFFCVSSRPFSVLTLKMLFFEDGTVWTYFFIFEFFINSKMSVVPYEYKVGMPAAAGGLALAQAVYRDPQYYISLARNAMDMAQDAKRLYGEYSEYIPSVSSVRKRVGKLLPDGKSKKKARRSETYEEKKMDDNRGRRKQVYFQGTGEYTAEAAGMLLGQMKEIAPFVYDVPIERGINMSPNPWEFTDVRHVDTEMSTVILENTTTNVGVGFISGIQQGDGENEREGRTIHLRGINVQGFIHKNATSAATLQREYECRVICYVDHQTNGTSNNTNQVYANPIDATQAINAFRDLTYGKQYDIIHSQVINIKPNLAYTGATYTAANASVPFGFYKKCNIEVNWSGTNSGISNVVDNAIRIMAYSTVGDSNLDCFAHARVFFTE